MATFYQQMSKDGIGRIGRLDEPQTAGCDYLPAGCSEEQRDDSATQTNEILKEQLDTGGQKLKLSNHQRRKLAKQGKRLGRKRLKEFASIATPDTILGWHRTLVALKNTASSFDPHTSGHAATKLLC